MVENINGVTTMTIEQLEADAKADATRSRRGKSRNGFATHGRLCVKYYANCRRFAYFVDGRRVNKCEVLP